MRRQWILFVSRKRAKCNPSKSFVVCSAHFTSNDFVRKFTGFAEKELKYDTRLKKDDIGISVIPSVYPKEEKSVSNREQRQVRCPAIFLFYWTNLSRKPSLFHNFVGCHDLDLIQKQIETGPKSSQDISGSSNVEETEPGPLINSIARLCTVLIVAYEKIWTHFMRIAENHRMLIEESHRMAYGGKP